MADMIKGLVSSPIEKPDGYGNVMKSKAVMEENAKPYYQALLAERSKTHGVYANQARITQALKGIISRNSDALNDSQREALDMIAMKISRILAGDPGFKDHWDDISGYAKLGGGWKKSEPVNAADILYATGDDKIAIEEAWRRVARAPRMPEHACPDLDQEFPDPVLKRLYCSCHGPCVISTGGTIHGLRCSIGLDNPAQK